jgi:hypothetical protein
MTYVGFACKCFSFRTYESVPCFTGFWPILSARKPFISNTSEIYIRNPFRIRTSTKRGEGVPPDTATACYNQSRQAPVSRGNSCDAHLRIPL